MEVPQKKSISGYFSNEIKPLYGKDICIFPIFIVANLQQPGNGNNLTVHWGMNGQGNHDIQWTITQS